MDVMEGNPWTGLCSIVAMDSSSMSYRACSICERTLPESDAGGGCRHCNDNAFNPGSFGSKRLYRLHLSVATSDKVVRVICFDRVGQALFGCSADAFHDFCKINPDAVQTACRVLEGDMFTMRLSKPKNGNAQHLRIVSLTPLSSQFRPVIEMLRSLYQTDESNKLQSDGAASKKRKWS